MTQDSAESDRPARLPMPTAMAGSTPADDGRLRVVMPVHNAEKFVAEAIRSVLDDLPETGELVIVDDGSADRSREIVADFAAKDPRVKVVRHETAGGVSRALNAGIEAPGCPEFVGVAEHDDVVVRGRFAEQLAALRADPTLGAVSGAGRYLGPKGRLAGRMNTGPHSVEECARMRAEGKEILIPHPAIIYRTAALAESGSYDPTFDGAQDLDLINRIVYSAGWNVVALPSVHVHYRVHGGAQSFSRLAEQRMMTRYISYRIGAERDGSEYLDYPAWRDANRPDRRTKLTWWRKDRGALHYRRAGLAWLTRQPLAFAGNLVAACVLHPRWVLMKARSARSAPSA